ncbi:MAG: hypothetical protein V2I41_20260, partial [Pseudomonadales bacterium]|nr:hypothetical protein [Pseudomonadales bacterium]
MNPLAEVRAPEARVAYCYYAFNLRAQNAAQRSNPTEVLALVQVVQDWQTGIERRFPDRRERSSQLIEAKRVFDRQLTLFSSQPGTSVTDSQTQLLSRSETACQDVLQTLAEYTPPTKPVPDQKTADSNPTEIISAAITSSQTSVEGVQKTPVIQTSPFRKGVFKSGWKGDLVWAGDESARMLVSSFDEIPTYAQDSAIHINTRSFGKKDVRVYCIGHMVEFDRSPDGLTLYLQPAEDAGCSGVDTVLSLHATAPNRVRLEVHHDTSVVAAGDLWSHNRAKVLVMNRVADNKPVAEPPSIPAEVTQQVQTPPINTTGKPPKQGAPQGRVQTEKCAACLRVDQKQENQVPSPYTVDFFDVPWQGRFHWD